MRTVSSWDSGGQEDINTGHGRTDDGDRVHTRDIEYDQASTRVFHEKNEALFLFYLLRADSEAKATILVQCLALFFSVWLIGIHARFDFFG